MSISSAELGHLIKRIQHRHHRTADVRLAKLGISLVQWNALKEIHRNPEKPQRQLAKLTFNSDQAFGTLVNRLLRMGLVEQFPGTNRATLHQLTQKGKSMLSKGQTICSSMTDESFAPLSNKERDQLEVLLVKVLSKTLTQEG